MDNVSIRIIDTVDDSHITSDEYARASSLILGWKGGDTKDELCVVGSYLKFTLISLDCSDGVYYDLFTGDETRFRVEFYNEDTQEIYWKGFLLPDAYEEPYKVGPIDVSFMATDGLGRLKGKFLPDDFYEEEKSVIEIITECLKLTGLDLDYRFSPAIENSQQKDYNQIYIDTSLYIDDDKEDAYTILEDLFTSMLCVIYQAENYWNIEGFNIREQRTYKTKVYGFDGVFIEEQEITRNAKKVTGVASPDITMQPPVGNLTVSHKRELFGLKENLSSEINEDWTYRTEGIETYNSTRTSDKESFIYVSDWFGRDGFFAYAGTDNKVFFTYASLSAPEGGQRIDLDNRPYIEAGQKYNLKVEFEIQPLSDDEEVNKNYVINGDWQNPFDYDIAYFAYPENTYVRVIGNGIAASNVKYLPINFGTGDKQTINLDFQFIPKYSGEFIVTIKPLKTDIGIDKVYINELSLEKIGDTEERKVSGTVTEGWTTEKELELAYGSDVNGLSKSFRLKKLNVPYNTTSIENDVIREFDYKGKHYVSLPLYAANLVDENRDVVQRPTILDPNVLVPVNVIDVIYNYNSSDEHVIITQDPIFTGKIIVDINDYGYAEENRAYWEQWSDTIYQVEKVEYVQAAYNVCERLLNKELPSILNLRVKNNIKFNDFITFTFNSKNDWTVNDCKLDIDKGFSDISIVQKYYISDQSYDPIVEAGEVLYIDDNLGTLEAEALDPDGFIVSYLWEEVTNTGSTIYTPNNSLTDVYLPSNAFYATFRVTVTDNEGNTASDTVDVYRSANLVASLTELFSDDRQFVQERHYRLDFTPDLPEDMSITVSGVLKIKYNMSYLMTQAIMFAEISQNGAVTTLLTNNYNYSTDAPDTITLGENNNVSGKFINFSFNYIKGDEIIIKLYGYFDDNNQPLSLVMDGSVDITGISFNDGFGVITGIPLNESIALSQL